MRHAALPIASIVLAVLAAACSSSSVPAFEATYDADLGRASGTQIGESLGRILNRHDYEIDRTEMGQATQFYFTKWLWRNPFDDEVAAGYSQANTRLTIEARVISRDVWRVRLRAENRLMRQGGSEWEQPALTEMCKRYLDQIAYDFRREFESRFR